MEKLKLRDLIFGLVIVLLFGVFGAFIKKSPNLKPLKVLSYGPNPIPAEVKAIGIVNVWITAENISYSCRILVNGKPVKSVPVEKPPVITATIPSESYQNSQSVRLQIVDPLTNRKSEEVVIKN